MPETSNCQKPNLSLEDVVTVSSNRLRELVDEVRKILLEKGILTVVVPNNIKNSLIGMAIVWNLFLNGDIGVVECIDSIGAENYSEFVTFMENYGKDLSRYIGKLLVLYDASIKKRKLDEIRRTIYDIMVGIESMWPKAPKPLVLIIIPENVYNMLSKKVRDMIEKYRFNVPQGLSLNDANEEEE